jgi:acyl carrier protein
MNSDALELVVAKINEVLLESGHERCEIVASTNILHDTPLDSLGLAIVVLRLEEATGKDPFVSGFQNFHTAGDLAQLYAN